MKPLRLVADDLTGALDSGCSFASPAQPVKVAIPGLPLPEGLRVAASTESRDMDRGTAVEAVARLVEALQTSDAETIWFKKIDSVMRGHPVAEIGAVLRSGSFDDCILAPAYPAMGRITVATRQYLLGADGVPTPVGPDFEAAFEEIGLSAAPIDDAAPLRTVGLTPVRIVEARNQEQLRECVAAIAGQPARRLWAGSGGLALALGGGAAPTPFPPLSAFIVGTAHPVVREQAARLGTAVTDSRHAASGVPLLLAPGLVADDASAAERLLRSALQDLHVPDPARNSVLVTGGATLTTVLEISAARCLDCIGEASPGVAVSRIVGGRWDGLTLLSKSGGFGGPSLFLDLLRAGGGRGPAGVGPSSRA